MTESTEEEDAKLEEIRSLLGASLAPRNQTTISPSSKIQMTDQLDGSQATGEFAALACKVLRL